MRFKEWLQLLEMQHVTMPKPMRINNVLCDGIDFRVEDWKKGFNPARHGGRAIPIGMPSPVRYIGADAFSAPMANGYLTVSHGAPARAVAFGGTALKPSTETEVQISAEPIGIEMPKQWVDFAVFYLGNKVVKPPEWPRDRSEEGSIGEIES